MGVWRFSCIFSISFFKEKEKTNAESCYLLNLGYEYISVTFNSFLVFVMFHNKKIQRIFYNNP